MPLEIKSFDSCYMLMPNGEAVKVGKVSSADIESDDIDTRDISVLKEASFTAEINMDAEQWYAIFGRWGFSNNWLKMHGKPMRRVKNLMKIPCFARKVKK